MRGALVICSTLCALHFTLVLCAGYDPKEAYCFHFTWLDAKYSANGSVNCSVVGSHQPCFQLIFTNDSSLPDVEYIWNNLNRTAYSCPMTSGFSCIKYTFGNEEAVERSSHFCGKVIEDNSTAITSGCYTQKVGVNTIETCACVSNPGDMPCNFSAVSPASITMVALSLILTLQRAT